MFSSVEKLLDGQDEPASTVIPGTEYSIPLLVSAQAHCPKISCSTTNINFLPTFVFNVSNLMLLYICIALGL